MKIAVCFSCGETKIGAFRKCEECWKTPETIDEKAISLAMTEHYFDIDTLKKFSEFTKENGKPPELDKPTCEQFVAIIKEREAQPPKKRKAKQNKPWWKFK